MQFLSFRRKNEPIQPIIRPIKRYRKVFRDPCHLSLGNDLGNRPVGSPPWIDIAGSLRKDPSQVTEKLNALMLGWYSHYLISISIGLFLFNAYLKKALYRKYDQHKGRKMITVFFILLAPFLAFLKSFHL